MPSPKETAAAARSWRDIPQEVDARALTPVGRQRRVLEVVQLSAIVLGIATTLYAGWWAFTEFTAQPQSLGAVTNAAPLKKITLRTDGVLDEAWVRRQLDLAPAARLVDLDLAVLHARLLATGQARAAVIVREFPTTLAVQLEERAPVARVRVRQLDAAPETWLVARDGEVFRGEGYHDESIDQLPWLDGIRLVRTGDRFATLTGLEEVSRLLFAAQNEAPHLYRAWQVVSLEHLGDDHELEVRCELEPGRTVRVRFDTREDYFRQLARLDFILDTVRGVPSRPLQLVNLAIDREVPVQFGEPLAAADPRTTPALRGPASAAPRVTPRNPFYPPVSPRRPSSREF